MRSQRAGLAQAESFLSVKLAEMAQLEERQLEINKLFRAVHSEKLSLQELADHASRLRNEQREQEKQAQLLDQESATHVARAEQIAKALSSARDHAELNRLERDLNASIELAESCSAGLSAAKGTAEAKAQDADQAAAATSSYFATFHAASSPEFARPGLFAELVAEQTPNGLNEQVVREVEAAGGSDAIRSALDGVRARQLAR